MDERERRVALNQTIFRAGNEALAQNVDPGRDMLPFMCECADESCFDAVVLTRAQYERIRAHPRRFVLIQGHENGKEPAHVVEEFDRFVILEKEEGAGRVAEEQDPRAEEQGST